MSEVELYLIEQGENCTVYTLQFLRDSESEFEKFVSKFIDNAEHYEDYTRIAAFVNESTAPARWKDTFGEKAKCRIRLWHCPSHPQSSDFTVYAFPIKYSFLEMVELKIPEHTRRILHSRAMS